MRRLLTIGLAALLLAPAAASAYTPREHALYQDGPNGRFLLDRGWTTSAKRSGSFRSVQVPNAFNARDFTTRGNRGRVQWYRERFTLPPASGAVGWRLRFESVGVRADVWLNGRRIGGHTGAYLPFELPATGIRRGSNELLVRVDGHASRDDIPPAGRSRGWWNYGGILREVYLRKVYRLDLGDPQVTVTSLDPGAGDGQRPGAQRRLGLPGERRRAGGERAERLQRVAAAERRDARARPAGRPAGAVRDPRRSALEPGQPVALPAEAAGFRAAR